MGSLLAVVPLNIFKLLNISTRHDLALHQLFSHGEAHFLHTQNMSGHQNDLLPSQVPRRFAPSSAVIWESLRTSESLCRRRSNFFVVNRPDFEASCIQRVCMSTCFALPSPLRLTKHVVAEASRCRFSLHDIPRSFATLWIPSPSDGVLTGAYHLLLLGPHLEAVISSRDDSRLLACRRGTCQFS